MRCILAFFTVFAGLFAVVAPPVFAQTPPDYGLTFETIGAPGNRGTLPSEMPLAPDYGPVGAVGYEYRLSQTEITNGQWLEFVRAYQPFHTGSPSEAGFTGWAIQYVGGGHYSLGADPNTPATMSWEYAARYCNWLSNGKPAHPTLTDFSQGAYDTSTFGIVNHVATDNFAHSPGAKFWIPSLDEWVKGAYYDPNKYGTGQEGYWLYPNKSDTPPRYGPPDQGGQSNAGDAGGPFNVGSYPNAQSPWGLLDISGGMSEWTSGNASSQAQGLAIGKGSQFGLGDSSASFFDEMDFLYDLEPPDDSRYGLRIASSVPAPGVIAICQFILLTNVRKRQRSLQRAHMDSH